MKNEYVKEYGPSAEAHFTELIFEYFADQETEPLKEAIQAFKDQIDNAK